jgi:outer membrane protein OmpU
MKKILLATTILSMSAGFAAADVAVSGDARMGVKSTDGTSTFDSRVRIKFSGSGTTDGGLAFGGSARADNASGASGGTAGSAFISGAFGKISMGDVDSGDNVGQLSSVGYDGVGYANSISYAADGGYSFDSSFGVEVDTDPTSGVTLTPLVAVTNASAAKVLYTYSAGAVSVSASSAQIGGDLGAYGVGAKYSAGDLTVAVGYGSSDLGMTIAAGVGAGSYDGSVTDLTASVGYAMGATSIKAIYQDKQIDASNLSSGPSEDASASAVSMGASVNHKIDALSLTAFVLSTNFESNLFPTESVSTSSYGLGASYDLGGGATFAAGWAHVEHVGLVSGNIEAVDTNKFDAGVNFSF